MKKLYKYDDYGNATPAGWFARLIHWLKSISR